MRLVELSGAGVTRLRPVLEQERKDWIEQLDWDYGPALKLIERFIAAGTLPGFAVEGPQGPVGYSYFVADRPVAFVGSLYLAREAASEQRYGVLLSRVVETIRQQAGIERIESQVFPFNAPLHSLFTSLGFEAVPRAFLSTTPADTPCLAAQGSFRIRPWDPRRVREAAGIIFDSYQGAPDQRLCRDYQSRGGCLRFVRNLVENPACGRFDPANSLVAEDERGGACGVLITSKIGRQVGMIPQLSVQRAAQGRGVGRLLLGTYLSKAADSGIQRVTLSVSESNERAFGLYRRLGFDVSRRFHAFLWER